MPHPAEIETPQRSNAVCELLNQRKSGGLSQEAMRQKIRELTGDELIQLSQALVENGRKLFPSLDKAGKAHPAPRWGHRKIA